MFLRIAEWISSEGDPNFQKFGLENKNSLAFLEKMCNVRNF